MLYKFTLFFFLIIIFCLQTAFSQTSDSVENKKNSISISLNKIPEIYKGMYRYTVISDLTNDERLSDITIRIQNLLTDNNLTGSSFYENYSFLKNQNFTDNEILKTVNDKEFIYSVWRAKLITIEDESELPEIMNFGMDFMMTNGYKEITDFLPFVTMLLQEHYKFHYDKSRISSFGNGATGIYDVADIFRTFETRDKTIVAGVCRDVHDAGLRMLREICTTYYNRFYPDKNINIDDYLFLTSWVTHNSQHVTISLIDPLNTHKTYELDWGRFIEKIDNVGYEHGRNYGNVYRVWKFDTSKNLTKAIDSKKTEVGNFFDDNCYNSSEFDAFSGIKNVETYSSVNLENKFKYRMELKTSIGELCQNQKFIHATFIHRTKDLKIGKLLKYSGIAVAQTMLMEEHEKKNLMFPLYYFDATAVLYGFPRYIANFRTSDIKISKNFTSFFYISSSIEVFLFLDYFKTDSNDGFDKIFKSGDGSIFITQGYQINFKSDNSKFSSEFKIHNRSFLIPKEVRLMSANPFELIKVVSVVSPAQDLILNTVYLVNKNIKIGTKSVLEFTNQKNLLTYNHILIQQKIQKVGFIEINLGFNKNLKGFQYFWYPVDRNWLDISYSNLSKNYKIGFVCQFYKNSELTIGAKLMMMF